MPSERDLGEARQTLESWLATRVEGAVEVAGLEVPSGVGLINETIFFDASWGDERAALVLRVQPSTHTVMYEAQEFFESQVKLMDALAEKTPVPVPRVRWYEPDPQWLDAPFFVMDRVEGEFQPDIPPYSVSGWLHDAAPEDQERLWWNAVETIAQVNKIDWQGLGLRYLIDPARGEPGLDERMTYHLEGYEWGRAGRSCPAVEAAREWLVENRPPENQPVTLSWGDARLANMIFRDFEVVGVLDWELASLGPALQDLGWLFFVDRALFGDKHTGDPDDPTGLPGFPPRAATIARWEELTGLSAADVDYYEIFAGFRLAINVQRTGVLFTAAGALPPDSAWPESNFASHALGELLGLDQPPPEPMPGHVGAES